MTDALWLHLCWVCELSATLLSYSSLTLCHQPQCHEYPFGPVVSKWVVSVTASAYFSLKWAHGSTGSSWSSDPDRMILCTENPIDSHYNICISVYIIYIITSHCDLCLAALDQKRMPHISGSYFGCLASVLEALLINSVLDGLLHRFSRQPMAWGREDMGTLTTSRPAMILLWSCYVRRKAGTLPWLLRGQRVAKNTSMAFHAFHIQSTRHVSGLTPQKSVPTILLTGSLWQADEDRSLSSQPITCVQRVLRQCRDVSRSLRYQLLRLLPWSVSLPQVFFPVTR